MKNRDGNVRFSVFLTCTLLIFTGFSLMLVVGSFYGVLERSMTHEYLLKIRFDQERFGNGLEDRLELLETLLQRLSRDQAIVASLMFGVEIRLAELITRQYPKSKGAVFFIRVADKDEFLPEIPAHYSDLVPALDELSRENDANSARRMKIMARKTYWLFSVPISKEDEYLGHAYAVYDPGQDGYIRSLLASNPGARLLIRAGHDLVLFGKDETVRKFDDATWTDLETPTDAPNTTLVDGRALIRVKGFSALYYSASIGPLDEKLQRLVVKLAVVCLLIFLLAILVAFLISRRVCLPLENLAGQALDISKDPSNRLLTETEVNYVEFRTLVISFNQVLENLENARREIGRKAQNELFATEELYRRTLEAAPDAIGISRMGDGRFLQINKAFSDIFGYPDDEIIANRLYESDLYLEDRVRIIDAVARSGEANGIETRAKTREGTVRDIMVSARFIRFAGEDCLITVATDITERKKAAAWQRLNESRLEALLELTQMDRMPISEIVNFSLQKAVNLTGSDIGFIAFVDDDETVFSIHDWSRKVFHLCEVRQEPIDFVVDQTGFLGEAVRQRRPVMVNDYGAKHPMKKGYPEGHIKIVRYLSVPAFEGDRIVAFAGIANKETDYEASDTRHLRLLIQGMWRLIQRKRSDDALRKLNEDLEKRVSKRTAQLETANTDLQKAANRVRMAPAISVEDANDSPGSVSRFFEALDKSLAESDPVESKMNIDKIRIAIQPLFSEKLGELETLITAGDFVAARWTLNRAMNTQPTKQD